MIFIEVLPEIKEHLYNEKEFLEQEVIHESISFYALGGYSCRMQAAGCPVSINPKTQSSGHPRIRVSI